MTTRHTPGDWTMRDGWGPCGSDGKMHVSRIASGPDDVMRTSNGGDLVATREDFELIAAAPDLLEACIEAEKNFCGYNGPLLSQLRAAIAKATK